MYAIRSYYENDLVVAFLKKSGFEDGEITVSPPSITDRNNFV